MNIGGAYTEHKSVEIRAHHGSVNAVRIAEWIKMCLRIVDTGLKYEGAVSNVISDAGFYEQLGMNKRDKQYWKGIKARMAVRSVTVRNDCDHQE